MVMVGFKGPDMFRKDRAGVDVLTAVLGASFTGRIFAQIREQLGQAYTLGGNYVPGMDTGLIYFSVQTSVDHVEAVRKKLLEIIGQVREEQVPEKELKETKAYLKGTFHMGLETDGQVAFMTSLDQLYGLGYDYYQGFDAAVDAVTPEDLLRLARKYFDPDRAVIVTALPREAGSAVAGAREGISAPGTDRAPEGSPGRDSVR
jgi:zinc protease